MKLAIHEHKEDNSFLSAYLNHNSLVHEMFDYPLTDEGIHLRLSEISARSYEREKIAHVLYRYNKQFTHSEETFRQIERLKDSRSVVVVGGQQAGILTGPLYTVNKAIAILHEAKRLEKKLSVPVIPIFWIAGEDHDIDEVSFTYFYHGDEVKRIKVNERNDRKVPVSNRTIQRETVKELIKEAFQFVSETKYTKILVEDLIDDLKEEITYVQWFSRIIHRLFDGTGLVLMDANDPEIRSLEKMFFKEMILRNDLLRDSFVHGAEYFKKLGYGEPITIQQDNAHLFIHINGERILLEKRDGLFFAKNGSGYWTEEQLINLLNNDPFPFSNNVVTRPVMQDLLFPVLSFIAGPGELKYWGTLKKVFHTFQIRMPLVYPRPNITLISRRTEKNMKWIGKTPAYVQKHTLKEEKDRWLQENVSVDLDQSFQRAQLSIEKVGMDLIKELAPLDIELGAVHGQFLNILEEVVNEYKKKVQSQVMSKNVAMLKRFRDCETELIPEGNLQERYLNIFPFLNMYGDDLVQRIVRLLEDESSLEGKNIYVYL